MQVRAASVPKVLVWTASGVVVAAGLAALAAGPGYQAGLWHYRIGFTILRWSVYVAAGAGLVALLGCFLAAAQRRWRTASLASVAVLLALILILPSWHLQKTAAEVPRIHDITTDTENPPRFVALLAARQKAPNGAEYTGEKIAKEQRSAYPDIRPVLLDAPPARAFERALAVARAMGWEIVDASPGDGRIEATATTRWFRFKDDIVIRVVPDAARTRVDVRSMSRIGRSDLGTNAKRIRAYVEKLTAS